MKYLWFIQGIIVGITLTKISKEEFKVGFANKFKDIGNSIGNFFKSKDTLKERNSLRLSIILVLILISYSVTAIVAITLGSWLHHIIGIVFAVLVIVLGVLTAVGLDFIKDNYEEGQSEMISFGENLVILGLQLLIGTIAIGAITILVTLSA